MTDRSDEKILLTPGPLTTSRTTREAMLRDWGSRDEAFIELTRTVRRRLVEIANGAGSHAAVLIQGSGTFAVEAMLGTFLGRSSKTLVLVNGSYCRRMIEICARIGRTTVAYETDEATPPDPAQVDALLAADPAITHVAIVHCETTSGILNPLERIAAVVAQRKRRLLVDAMSSFGAIPLDIARMGCEAVAASANKCLEGVPGVSFVIGEGGALAASAGNAPSLSLDLHDQWRTMEKSGQWRFTPPTHVMAAFVAALAEHEAEGGVAGRGARYGRNLRTLVDGMRALGFVPYLPDALQAPIIATFRKPADPRFDFEAFYQQMARRGFLIYPGKLTAIDSFRIGCIGRIEERDLQRAVGAVRDALSELGVTALRPAA